MALKIYNTRTRQKEEFVPVYSGKVNLYVCGVTVYDDCHVGHGRAYVVFDMIVRYLKHLGYLVNHVRNVTDIDDKIIDKARQTKGESPLIQKVSAISQYFYSEFEDAMQKLNVESPNVAPAATKHISKMIELIQLLLKNKVAYLIDGDVYFDIQSWKKYGALSGRNLDELKAGARVEVDPRKRNPLDFVLWKKSKPEEPSWESPWGPGRPGWHIECSAMSMKYLGTPIDIHGGGQDLIFPHHENELAQSEAATGTEFVKYWIHNAFITVDKQKMSKSLGNFFVLKDVFDQFSPELIRFYYLTQHYRSPMEFSDVALKEAHESFKKIENCVLLSDRFIFQRKTKLPKISAKHPPESLTRFEEAMDDDFNTPRAFALIFELIGKINTARESNQFLEKDLENYVSLSKILEILGVKIQDKFFKSTRSVIPIIREPALDKVLSKQNLTEEDIEELYVTREKYRKEKRYDLADKIRKKIEESGIYYIEDTPTGPRIRKKD